MKIYLYITIFFLFILAEVINCQEPPRPKVFVKSINVKCIDTTYQIKSQTRSGERKSISKHNSTIAKYLYKIEIIIKLDGQYFNFPLVITCHYPGNQKRSIIVNQNQSIIKNPPGYVESDELFDYSMLIMTKTKGDAKISLAEWDDKNLKIISESNIIFEDFIFTLQ